MAVLILCGSNPCLLEKLVRYCGIDQNGTYFPPNLYDPKRFAAADYYKALSTPPTPFSFSVLCAPCLVPGASCSLSSSLSTFDAAVFIVVDHSQRRSRMSGRQHGRKNGRCGAE